MGWGRDWRWEPLVSYFLAGHLLEQQSCCLSCYLFVSGGWGVVVVKRHRREKAGLPERMAMGQGLSHSLEGGMLDCPMGPKA